jgi:para-nitrobenzyl esterase
MKNAFVKAAVPLMTGFAVIFLAFTPSQPVNKTSAAIAVQGGLITGIKNADGDIVAYKGIPYATPPIGIYRWRAPQPVTPWQGVKACKAYSASPMQAAPTPFMVYTPEFLIAPKPISEDCLYLNVWSGAHRGDKKPVFVWIYGGGFSSGGTSVPIYDGESMAKKGIVFVSINYRVGVFGFLAHPDLSKESPNHVSGNYGLLDQVAALKWVQRNITAFGGDPNNVTIDGQSAGSMSVNCLVASPVAKGTFAKAIAESGSFMINNPLIPTTDLQAAEQQGLAFQDSANVKTLAELRRIPAEALLKIPGHFAPIIDGYVLPKPVYKIFADGEENPVPVITGWNADESFVMKFQNKDEYIAGLKKQYGADAAKFLKYYPGTNDSIAARSQVKISRDQIFAMSGYKWLAVQSAQGKAPIYAYNFDRKLPATPDFVKYGAFHTGEVAYVMDNLKFLNRPWEDGDQPLATYMSAYWVNFMKTGDPNGRGLPKWPQYNNKTQQAMVFDVTSAAQTLPDKDELKFMVTRVEGPGTHVVKKKHKGTGKS